MIDRNHKGHSQEWPLCVQISNNVKCCIDVLDMTGGVTYL